MKSLSDSSKLYIFFCTRNVYSESQKISVSKKNLTQQTVFILSAYKFAIWRVWNLILDKGFNPQDLFQVHINTLKIFFSDFFCKAPEIEQTFRISGFDPDGKPWNLIVMFDCSTLKRRNRIFNGINVMQLFPQN